MIKISLLIAAFTILIFLTGTAGAHCPLCTVGAAAAAGGAVWLGVSKLVVGLFVGAFAVSMGFWISRKIKKSYIPFQKALIIVLSFVLTILPLLPTISSQPYPLYITLFGDYGSLFNRVYLINASLLSSLIGGVIVAFSPKISSILTKSRRGKKIPFQGVIITLSLLLIIGIIIQISL